MPDLLHASIPNGVLIPLSCPNPLRLWGEAHVPDLLHGSIPDCALVY